jgi:hypothetical protein
MECAVTARIRWEGYAGGARGGFSLARQRETKPFSRTGDSAAATTNPIAPISADGGAIARWHSVHLLAEHWS